MNEDLQQHLMEFVYGLLDEDEANALSERITSDPQFARDYAKVRLQCDLVGRAARFEAPKVAWIRPEGIESSHASPPAASTAGSAARYRRLANWCIGVAACGLLCLVGSSYLLSPRSRPAQVVLTGPSKLDYEASNPFTVQVENRAGTPVSTTLNYRVYDAAGAVTWEDETSTDASGIARFDVEPVVARRASRLNITAGDDSSAPIQMDLETAPERFVTYLRMDRPLYQPDEKVQYRSVTLSRFGLQSEDEVTTSFEIVNSNGETLAGTKKTMATKDGVGWGVFKLPNDLADGTYTLIARNPDSLFREEWRDFRVERFETPRLLKKLDLARDSYTAGDQVDFDFSVKHAEGEPLADAQLQIQATLDGFGLDSPQATTDAEGKSRFSLALPDSIERGEANVSVTVRAGSERAETITKQIPINLGKVNVDFYPEGGDLAAGLPSRVYFYARDPLGKPTHIEGRILDSHNDEFARVVTGHEGRGVFSLTPVDGQQYRLILDKPVGVTKEVPLPATSAACFATIETGAGVFAANAPITYTLHQRTPAQPLAVAAYCRGAMVGQQTIDPDACTVVREKFATFRGELELPPQVQGVVRLTVFDAAHTPAEPIAERLVYRRVGQKLDVRLTTKAETVRPGKPVYLELEAEIRDENAAPVPAVLGIAIVDDAVLNFADDKSTRLPTYFHLLSEIDQPQQLEDANFYLSDESGSEAALDSLLGAQGWRRFHDLPSMQLAQAAGGRLSGGAARLSLRDSDARGRFRSMAWDEVTAVPFRTTTMMDVRVLPLGQPVRSAIDSSWRRGFLTLPMIVASIVLLVLVGVASLRWGQGNRSLRVFAGVVAVVSLLVGVLSLPMQPIRVGQATDNATSAVTEVSAAMDKGESIIAEKDDVVTTPEAAAAAQAGDLMSKNSDLSALPDFADEPMALEPAGSKLTEQLEEAPKEALQSATRFVQPERQPARRIDAAAAEKAEEMLLNKEKKAVSTSPAPRPLSETASSPEKPQPTANALFGRATMRDVQQPLSVAGDVDREILTREYAKWFYEARSNTQPTGTSSPTLLWLPHHKAAVTGKALLGFPLPQRPSNYRVIVEAHAGGRLGAGELLIDPREP